MTPDDPFSPAKRAEMRAEILQQGLLADKFLSNDPDIATFGVNLACAWPFPEEWRDAHADLAARLAPCGRWLYVYPHAFTHITLVTFITFSRHVKPTEDLVGGMRALTEEVVFVIETVLREAQLKSFELQPQVPVLSRAAGILPFRNPDGGVQRLRQTILAALQRDDSLHNELERRGFSVPGIIHSTLMRFVQTPPDLNGFLKRFDAAADAANFPPLRVSEVLLTDEIRPYMRGGRVLRRFPLT